MSSRILLLLFLLLPAHARAGDWPNWRGPGFDGTVTGTPLAGRETFGLEVTWRRELGSGYSAIVVSGNTAVTLFSDHQDDFVIALDASSGSERWRYRLGPTYRGHDGSEDGPSGTPTIAGGCVFALGPSGLLAALEFESGRLIWRVELAKSFTANEPRFGFTAPPLAFLDMVMVSVGATGGKTFVAFDAATGEVRWTAGDDSVSYEASILTSLAGRSQIVGMSNHRLTGIAPETGEVLWTFEYHPGEAFGTSQVFALGNDRLVVQDGRETAVYRFAAPDADPPLEEVWRARVLGSALSTPVAAGDHLYGFAGNFLTAVRLADGEKVWKSRPPGGTGLLLADGHLITLGKGGDLVIVRATPNGYEETARVNVLDDPGPTYPTFADGRIFVRNTRQIAAVHIVDRPPDRTTAPTPADAFEAFVRRASSAADPRGAVRAYMRTQTRFPIVIGKRVHFVYWGPAEDVAIAGTMTDGGDEDQLAPIPGTDFFHRSYELPGDGRAEYWLVIDFENRLPDPLNPRRRPFPLRWYDFEVSELQMPGYNPPAWSTGAAPGKTGTMEVFSWTSPSQKITRTVGVYLPEGYVDGKARLPLAVFLDGDLWRTRGALPDMLDRAIAGGAVRPVVGVFLGSAEGLPWQEMSGGTARRDFEQSLVEEIVPMLLERYRIDESPTRHAIVGRLSGTRPALETVLNHPDVFEHAILIESEWSAGVDREILEHAGRIAPDRRARINVHWSRAGSPTDVADDDRAVQDRRFLAELQDLGCPVFDHRVHDAAGWWSWNLQALAAVTFVSDSGE